MEGNHFLNLLIISTIIGIGYGLSLDDLRYKRQTRTESKPSAPTADECMKPPMKRFAYECCQLPKEKIWGDLSESLNKCFARRRSMRREEAKKEVMSNGKPEGSNIDPIPGRIPKRNQAPENRKPWLKNLKERASHLFTSVYKVIKGSIDVLWQSVVMLTDIFKRRQSDACFMECVFEDQGFLLNKKVNKQALLNRLQMTLGNNQEWYQVAVQSVETCYAMDFSYIPNNTTCLSGSEDLFRCIFKQIFFNCPTWPLRNEYCSALKEFYQKCPNGPPPEVEDIPTTSSPESESEDEAPAEGQPESEDEAETEATVETETPQESSSTEETQ